MAPKMTLSGVIPSKSPLTQLPSTVTGAEAKYVSRTNASNAAAIGRLVLHGKLIRRIKVTASREARGSMHSSTAAAGPLQQQKTQQQQQQHQECQRHLIVKGACTAAGRVLHIDMQQRCAGWCYRKGCCCQPCRIPVEAENSNTPAAASASASAAVAAAAAAAADCNQM
jgi:hypothetical protein